MKKKTSIQITSIDENDVSVLETNGERVRENEIHSDNDCV